MVSPLVKKRLVDAVRGLAASNLYVTESLNHMLGRVGEKRYLALVAQSEHLDPVANFDGIRAIRARMDSERLAPRYPNRTEAVNTIYGIKRAIFGSASTSVGTPSIEHGLFLGDYIYPADSVHTAAPSCVTFGEYRRSVIWARQGLPTFCVGPYIHYAEPHYSVNHLTDLKRNLGRTAVVFLSHATEDSKLERPRQQRFTWIDEIAEDNDSVIICAFWWDALDPDLAYLEAKGYHVVSCGLTHDRNFLSRQKSLLRLADTAAGDGIGTHVGYCLAEGVPFRLVDAGTSMTLDMGRRTWMTGHSHRLTREQILSELTQVFGDADSTLTQQLEVANPYWGFDQLKTKSEIQRIAEISLDIARRCLGQVSGYRQGAEKLLLELEAREDPGASLLASAMPG